MEKLTLRGVVEIGLRLAAVALFIGAVIMTGVGMFALVTVVPFTPAGVVTVILVCSVAPVVGAIALWRAANHVLREGRASGQ
jgi:hypothetical protein